MTLIVSALYHEGYLSHYQFAFFFLRKRLTAESSAVGANIGIVSKIIFLSIAIEVSVLIFQEDQIWQMLILSVEKASLVTIGLLVVNSL